ncbi:MAG: alanine racemase [Alphaproteobacteria bacterium]|nr:alanine racemase [Alphaproteobacteria bacterium]
MPPSDRAHARLTIDLDAIATNYRLLGKRLEPAGLHAVVKADAYGLGLEPVARTLRGQGCRHFFVATLDEGIALRALLSDVEIGVFNGALAGEETAFAAHRLTPCLNDLGQIERFRALAPSAPAGLQIDTGMARLGLPPQEVERLAAEPQRLAGLSLSFLFSHLACADTPPHPKNAEQLRLFRTLTQQLPATQRSLANSSGIFLGPEYHFDFARAGAAIYGVNPQASHPNPMAQVLHLKGRILQVRDVDSPQTVGYGATYRASGVSRIATVAVGYADGYLRTLGNRGSCFVGDRQVPVIGRISMDLITIDVTEIPPQQLTPDTFVELVGPNHSVDALAAEAGTIGYEILTSLGHRYHRNYIGKGS